MLISNGWSVLTLAADNEYSCKLTEMGVTHNTVFLNSTGTNPFVDFMTLIHFWWIYRKKPTAVLNFTPKCNIYSCLAAYIRGVPSINNISGMGIGMSSKGHIRFFLKNLNEIASRLSFKTYFQNSSDQDYFLKEFKLPSEKSILISGSGVNLKYFKYVPLNKSSKIRFGMFTRIIKEKGVRHFVEAAKVIKQKHNVEFIMAGPLDPNRRNSISLKEVESWNSEGIINYLGVISDIRPVIETCDCVVLPSYYPEGTPKILIESAAIGRPIITTDHPGCRDTVSKVNGYLIQKKSTESLISAMECFLKLPYSKIKTMSKESRKIAEKYFDENFILHSYATSIQQIINKKTL